MSKQREYSFVHDGVAYTFTTEAQKAEHASQIAGRPVFRDQEVCYARIPSLGAPKQANSDLISPEWLDFKDGVGRVDRPLSVFHDHYDRWKAGMENAIAGTPLQEHSDLTQAMIKTLEASKIDTLEQLAKLDPSDLSKVLGPKARDIVERAKELTAAPSADVKAVREENARLSSTIESQGAQLDELRKQIAALQSGASKAKKNEAA